MENHYLMEKNTIRVYTVNGDFPVRYVSHYQRVTKKPEGTGDADAAKVPGVLLVTSRSSCSSRLGTEPLPGLLGPCATSTESTGASTGKGDQFSFLLNCEPVDCLPPFKRELLLLFLYQVRSNQKMMCFRPLKAAV